MERFWIAKCAKFTIFALLAILVMGYLVMWLWNWLLPDLLNASEINFLQSIGLIVLSKLLFGGFKGFGNKSRRHEWKSDMKEKYKSMSPEEQRKFRERFKLYCKHSPPPEKDKEDEIQE